MIGTERKYKKKAEKIDYWNSGRHPRTMEGFKPGDQKGYWYYFGKRKKKEGSFIQGRTDYRRAVISIYEAIAQLVIEHEGGVQLEKYGYFHSMILPHIPENRKSKRKEPNFHTQGYVYTLQLFTDTVKNSVLKGMVMDRTFNQALVSRFSKALYDGFRPKLYHTMLKSLKDINDN